MPDEIFGTGGNPVSAFIHGVWRNDDPDLNVTRMVQTDENGSIIVAPAEGAVFQTEITAPLPLPVDTEDRVVLVSTEDRIVRTTETLHETYAVERYDVPFNLTTGSAVTGKPTTEGGFMVTAPSANFGTIWWGSAADKCLIEIPPGSSKTFAYASPNGFFWRSDYDFAGAADPEEQIQDKLVIEYYD